MSAASKKNDSFLNFIESGKGKLSLVFLHYFGGSSITWEQVTDELNEDFHCIAIDLPGFGASQSSDDKLSVSDIRESVVEVIESLQLENYVLIGHSMGGKIALSLASHKSFGLKKLLLFAPSPPTPEPMTEKEQEQLLRAYNNRSALINNINNITHQPLADFDINNLVNDNLRASEIAWTSWIECGSKEDISAEMCNIAVPVLVINGQFDKNLSGKFLRNKFLTYFPFADFHEIREAGHLLPIEAPLAVVKLIREAVKSEG
jgi:pimeloyl-ACP methyl ester carboxylesterase